MGCRVRGFRFYRFEVSSFAGEVSGFTGSRFPARFSAATAVYTCLLQKNFGQKTPGWQDLTTNRKFTTIRQQIRVELQHFSQQLD